MFYTVYVCYTVFAFHIILYCTNNLHRMCSRLCMHYLLHIFLHSVPFNILTTHFKG